MEPRERKIEVVLEEILKQQKEFTSQVLCLLGLQNKEIYSTNEAAMFLGLRPGYIYQLVHQKKIKPVCDKKKEKLRFRRSDLELYLVGNSATNNFSVDYDSFEKDIIDKWNK